MLDETIKINLNANEICKTLEKYFADNNKEITSIKVNYKPSKEHRPPASVYMDEGYTVTIIGFECEYQKEISILSEKKIISDKIYINEQEVIKIYNVLLLKDNYEVKYFSIDWDNNDIIDLCIKKRVNLIHEESNLELIFNYLSELNKSTQKKLIKTLGKYLPK